MQAIIKTGGKQYKVSEGDTIYIEKLDAKEGDEVSFDVLVTIDGDATQVGKPLVDGAVVKGKVVGDVKGQKIIVFKYKPKKNVRKKQGHRQPYTKVEIMSIG